MGKNELYIRDIISDYCVIDTETTGFSSYYDEIIEVGILKVRNNEVIEQYSQLVKPDNPINSFITELTGITNEMLLDMPKIKDIERDIKGFIGDDIIIGHNTSFDIRFLNEAFTSKLQNKYIDTLQFARKLYPELEHHRLSDLTKYLNLSDNMHRSISDCIATKELYDAIKNKMDSEGLSIRNLWKNKNSSCNRKKLDIKDIKADDIDIDEDNFFYGKHVVFTGKLDKMLRKDAMQMVVNLGGILDNNVKKTTNYLILGNNDYNSILKGEKSSKQKKAEKLKLEGQDIEIMDELTFYDILSE